MIRRLVLGASITGALLGSAWVGTYAIAATPGPGYLVESIPYPTNFTTVDNELCGGEFIEHGSCNSYLIQIKNSGSSPTDGSPITITDILPTGVTAQFVKLEVAKSEKESTCSLVNVQCVYTGVLAAGEVLNMYIYAYVAPDTAGSITNAVEVSGGGAISATASSQNSVSSSPPAPGLSNFTFTLDGANGAPDTQAGDHPAGATASFQFASELNGRLSGGYHWYSESGGEGGTGVAHGKYGTPQAVKDIVVDLPPGFVGDTQEATQCDERELEPTQGPEGEVKTSGETKCPPSSAVGTVLLNEHGAVEFGGTGTFLPTPIIYNMVPEHGYPAEFGFNLAGIAIILYATAVPSSNGYVLQVSSPGIVHFLTINGLSLTFWGVPGEATNDALRGGPSDLTPVAFLTNPMDCSSGPLTATAMSDTWQDPGRWTAEGEPDLSDPAWRVRKLDGVSVDHGV